MAIPAINGYFTELSNGSSVPLNDAMKYEALRLGSFRKYPQHLPQSALKLASAGFFFTGVDDEVECFSCSLKLKDWGVNDVPLEVHIKYSPDCPYVNNNLEGNIPLASKGPVRAAATAVTQQFSQLSTNEWPGKGQAVASQSLTTRLPQADAHAEYDPSTHGYAAASVVENTKGNHQYSSGQVKQQNDIRPTNLQNISRPLPGNQQYARTNIPISSSLFPQPQVESSSDYRYESSRLASFTNWPSNAAVRPDDLARSGFYYTGSDDRVQCTFCRGILRNWEPNDEPEAEHRRHFGQCPFLSNRYGVGNIALGDPPVNRNDPAYQDYCQSIVTEKPVHQNYSFPADRLATFKDFPTNMTQSPEMFVRAGFYYSGISDNVKCFFCDGGLRNWEPNDDPWTEHARWFPRCGYLRLCKGDEYVKEVQSRYAPPPQHRKPPRLRLARGHKHPVDPRKVTEYMRTAIVKAVLEMEVEKDKVKQAIIRRIEDLGEDFFPNSESLLDAVLEYEEELKYTEVHGEENDDNEEQNEQQNTNDANVNNSESKKKNKKKKKKGKKNAPEDKNNVLGITEPMTHMDEEEAKHLAEDVQRLKDERTCKVCMDEEVNVVFLRCGHLVCCANCAPAMRHCPICRETIRGTVRVFLS